jgi:hypothetical protein
MLCSKILKIQHRWIWFCLLQEEFIKISQGQMRQIHQFQFSPVGTCQGISYVSPSQCVKLFSFEGKNPRIILVNKVYACCYHLSFPLHFLYKKQILKKEMISLYSDTNPYTNLNYMNKMCSNVYPHNWRVATKDHMIKFVFFRPSL